jgi:hypothetical protein
MPPTIDTTIRFTRGHAGQSHGICRFRLYTLPDQHTVFVFTTLVGPDGDLNLHPDAPLSITNGIENAVQEAIQLTRHTPDIVVTHYPPRGRGLRFARTHSYRPTYPETFDFVHFRDRHTWSHVTFEHATAASIESLLGESVSEAWPTGAHR